MYVLTALGGGAALIFAIYMAISRRKRSRRREQELTRLQAWLKKIADATSDESLASIEAPSEHWSGEEVMVAIMKRRDAIERLKESERLLKEEALQIELQKQLDAIWLLPEYERCAALLDFNRYRLNEKMKRRFDTERKFFFAAYTGKLYDMAERGDSQAFFRLCTLVEAGHSYHSQSDYRRATGEEYHFPASWDELMVGFVKMPTPTQFHNQPEVNEATVQVLAPQALRQKNLVLAKWVLAVTRGSDADSQTRRRAVGETFHGRLLDFVDRRHEAMQDSQRLA